MILDIFFPYSGEEATRQALSVSLKNIAEIPLNLFSFLDVHMWYIYLLIGLYLYLPSFFCMGGESIGESSIMDFWPLGGLLLCYLIIMNMFRLTYGVVVHGTHSVCFIILPVSTDTYC